jgi:hypothetical protein
VGGDRWRRLLLEDEMKSTVDEIRQRFDGDTERFANLETGCSGNGFGSSTGGS